MGCLHRATLIYSPKDTALHESFIANDSPNEQDLRAVHQFLQANRQTSLCKYRTSDGHTPGDGTRCPGTDGKAGLVKREPFDDFGMIRVQVAPLT